MPAVRRRLIVFVANEAQLPFDYYYRLRTGEEETGVPAGFFDADPPRTLVRVRRPSDLDGLRRRVESGGYDDLVFVVSHAGWADKDGRYVEGYSDPDALTVRYMESATLPADRIDVPDDQWHHDATIWRRLPPAK